MHPDNIPDTMAGFSGPEDSESYNPADFAKRHRAKAQVSPGIDYEPAWDSILVDPLIKVKTSGGVIMPEMVRSEDDTGRSVVIAVGPGTYTRDGDFVPVPILVGDIIYNQTRMHCFRVRLGDKFYIAMSARDIVGYDRSGNLLENEIRGSELKPSTIIPNALVKADQSSNEKKRRPSPGQN